MNSLSTIRSRHWVILGVLWQRRHIIAAAAIACVVIALIYLVAARPQYQSTAKLYIESRSPRIISDGDGFRAESKNFLFTQAAIIKSVPILQRAVEMPEAKELRSISRQKAPRNFLRKSLVVTVGEHQDIVSVTCRARSGQDAAVLANAVARAYVDFHASKKRSTAAEVLGILREEKGKWEADLEGVLARMLAYRKGNKGVLLDGGGVNIELARLGKLTEVLTLAELDSMEAESKLQAAEGLAQDPQKVQLFLAARRSSGYYVPVDLEESRLRADLNKLNMQLVACMRETTSGAPAAIAARQKIEQLQNRLTERQRGIAEACLAAARQEFQQAKRKEDALRQAFEQQQVSVQELGVKSTEFEMLKSELERTEQLIAVLDSRIKEIDIAEDTGAMHIMILENAEPASGPFRPNRKMTLAVALVLGLILGAAGALVWEGIDDNH